MKLRCLIVLSLLALAFSCSPISERKQPPPYLERGNSERSPYFVSSLPSDPVIFGLKM
jgi:hypothetical protein